MTVIAVARKGKNTTVRCADQRGELDPQGFDHGCW